MIGEYFADYDFDTGMWCVFHTDKNTGFAYSSWGSEEDAIANADKRNEDARRQEKDSDVIASLAASLD